MFVPLTVDDFLQRAETVFADTVALVDEPTQPAVPVPRTTYGELARRVRAWQAGLDALGVRPGERRRAPAPRRRRRRRRRSTPRASCGRGCCGLA